MENDLDITYKKQSKHLEMVKSYNHTYTYEKTKPPKAPVSTSQLYLTFQNPGTHPEELSAPRLVSKEIEVNL